jgi:hypothetical protein
MSNEDFQFFCDELSLLDFIWAPSSSNDMIHFIAVYVDDVTETVYKGL